MQLTSLRVRNYKALQNLRLDRIPRLSIFTGANGSGKSTLFDVFAFLRDALRGDVRSALDARGRFAEVVTRGHEGEPIAIELRIRLALAGVSRTVSYRVTIAEDAGRPVIAEEELRHGAGQATVSLLRFDSGAGYAINDRGRRERQSLESMDTLAIKGLGQFQRFPAAVALRQLIETWHISDFDTSAARGRKEISGAAEHLSVSGDNLPRVARFLYENHRERFDEIVQRMRERVPGLERVEPELTQDGYLILRFRDGTFQTPFLDRSVSGGTIRMFAYLVLLHDPEPHPLLCIEEPENQLYPSLMRELAEEFRDYARRGGQVMVSTHSPDMLNAAELGEVFWLVKERGFSSIRRASEDPQVAGYAENGEKLGTLWRRGLFDGAHPL